MSQALQSPLPREIRALSYSLPTVAALLERASTDTNTGLDIASGVGHEEAAAFVAADIDAITASWTGTEHELAYLRAFVADFT
jgi:hypothetical protein